MGLSLLVDVTSHSTEFWKTTQIVSLIQASEHLVSCTKLLTSHFTVFNSTPLSLLAMVL